MVDCSVLDDSAGTVEVDCAIVGKATLSECVTTRPAHGCALTRSSLVGTFPIARRRSVVFTVVASVALVAACVAATTRRRSAPRSGGSSQGAGAQPRLAAELPRVGPGRFDDLSFRKRVEACRCSARWSWSPATPSAGEDGGPEAGSHDPPEPYAFPIDAFGPAAGLRAVRGRERPCGDRAGAAERSSRARRTQRPAPAPRTCGEADPNRVGPRRAVVPDDAVGWSEMLVNREVGIGSDRPRALPAGAAAGALTRQR